MENAPKYYYFPPFRPQFYFPKARFKQFVKYYKPFSFKAKLFWFVFLHIPIFREAFIIHEKELPKHFTKIKEVLNLKNASIFFNSGTEGPEQKTTAIAKNDSKQRFIKFGETDLAMQLIGNELEALNTIKKNGYLKGTPEIVDSQKTKSYSYLVTNVINGFKLETIGLNHSIVEFLKLFIIEGKTKDGLYQNFSHGDFCPWNIIVDNKENIIPIDWEMANKKILGYDLFTFIFHTSFLLTPKREVGHLLKENQEWIKQYFNHFKVKDFDKYLYSFATSRLSLETNKPTNKLYQKYKKLQALYGPTT